MKKTKKFLLENLKDPRVAQVESFALPENGLKLTPRLCRQIQQRLPRIVALDAPFWMDEVDIAIEGFAPLLHLRLSSGGFGAEHLRTLLATHEQLHVFEIIGS